MSDAITLEEATSGDPAVPGDPFTRLRYHYGMLLGAEDFAVEQREKVLRRRLHQAVLHGAGTAWGLRVTREKDADDLYTRIVVKPGLAVDPLGRDLWVGADLCLDISGLAQNAIWGDLEVPGGSTAKRAYVVIRYEACRSRPVPAITAPCDEPGDAVAWSRVLDRCRIDLAAAPPADPDPLAREWLQHLLAADPRRSPREALLAFLLDPPFPVDKLWKAPAEAALLLAVLDLDVTGTGDAARVVAAADPDNGRRALLPSVQALAESALGQRLGGAPLAPAAFQVLACTVKAAEVRVRLTEKPHAALLASSAKAFEVRRLAASGWTDLTAGATASWDDPSGELVIALGATLSTGDVVQVRIFGDSAAPLVSQSGAPLAGRVGDPITHPRQGRDVSIIDTVTP